ncbi:putative steryl acetyl hydrolase mug81 [Dispira simplex]|nr:putative steryl acetyl hydrolase mug81 [Dispira simplex]
MDHSHYVQEVGNPVLALQCPAPAFYQNDQRMLDQITVQTAHTRPFQPRREPLSRGAHLRQARVQALRRPRNDQPLKPSSNLSRSPYPHVYDSSQGRHNLPMLGDRYALPAGTIREDNPDYEELVIPATRATPPRIHEKIVEKGAMDLLCQTTFRSYTALNRIQSIVYPVAYHSNENMLVCAPTGAGKTDVAMLTMLRTISLYCDPKPWEVDPGSVPEPDKLQRPPFTVAKDSFKIIYVAPMKALAAEIVQKMGKRLRWLGIVVRELTGDMQLTKAEINATQVIVTTPEKWDVVTRKSTGDVELVQKVRLIIIDEVHLLHEDRGAVIESIVARTLRQVETSQSMIRIVGLSATLPNYLDVAQFLRVNPYEGLFVFDAGFRPVPLEQHFVGVKGKPGTPTSNLNLNRVCYQKCVELVEQGHQVMVFVHSRKDTVKTAQFLRTKAQEEGTLDYFANKDHPRHDQWQKDVGRSRNRELRDLFATGFAMHHAGMLRSDRNLVERLFAEGAVSVLCCTATLAWGVNLPAYAVVIKGTQVYNAQKGSFVDLSILDVLQIFGRAGRPQYENQGVGYIMTTHDRLAHYISAITHQHPIESCFAQNMVDNLNAEISLGTVTNVHEAVVWLSYTFLYVRMRQNPLVYGMNHSDVAQDPLLGKRRHDLITDAAKRLHQLQMIVYDAETGYLLAKDLGRIASSFYLEHSTVETINQFLRPHMTEADSLALLSLCSEFHQVKVRDTEAKELETLLRRDCCCAVKGGAETSYGKVNILLQASISRSHVEDFTLLSDLAYIRQNAGRLMRALFEIAVTRHWGPTAAVLLTLNKCIENQMWPFDHPLAQFPSLPYEVIQKLERQPSQARSIDALREMDAKELGQLVRHGKMGDKLQQCVREFPRLELTTSIAPITQAVLRVHLDVEADFEWNDRVHGTAEPWWIWVEDSEQTDIYHIDQLILQKRSYRGPHTLDFTIPIHTPLPPQIYIRALSDRWLGAETLVPVSFQHLILPQHEPRHTDLLDLVPLPVRALQDPTLEAICAKRFAFFNPVQSQIFHTLYRTPHNALIGAPTGSGKTVAAELAMWWAFRTYPGSKVVYIAPLKALVRERVQDWQSRLVQSMRKRLVELTGDVTPDLQSVKKADIIITTPEKWDGISRGWQTRPYVRAVSLVIIDEIHLLGSERGPTLEVIVSRINYISAKTTRPVRVVGLSTALANAQDLADWLGIPIRDELYPVPTGTKKNTPSITCPPGLYNFRHSVRPVPLEIYIDGFPGKHYCPRMATMNKPAYRAIMTHSRTKPVIIFVSSRRQTRLTAQDLIAYCGQEENPRQFLRLDDGDELDTVLAQVSDPHLKLTLGFGIGLHHAGLPDSDRRLIEELFLHCKIQVLVATSTLAWGVNLPAHLVIIKGTEFFDAKTKGYVDFPITDILQMMGRAGRPQFDNSGIARIFVQDSKKAFYKRFLHEPFPVESSLHKHLTDHLNAEITAGTIRTRQDALDYLTWTYLYRRLPTNPTYYGLQGNRPGDINRFLSDLVDRSFADLEKANCIEEDSDGFSDNLPVAVENIPMVPTPLGKIASHYYLNHRTAKLFSERIQRTLTHGADGQLTFPSQFVQPVLALLCEVPEYAELPVRHNEDLVNRELSHCLPFAPKSGWTFDSPHTKAYLLLQAYFERLDLPVADYLTDTQSVLDQAVRILQAMVSTTSIYGYLTTTLQMMMVIQCIKQAQWPHDSQLLMLPHIRRESLNDVTRALLVPELMVLPDSPLMHQLQSSLKLTRHSLDDIARVLRTYPIIEMSYRVEVLAEDFANPDATSVRVLVHVTLDWQKYVYSPSSKHPSGAYHTTYKPWPVPPGQAYSTHFRKQANEGWWLVLGDPARDEILTLQSISFPVSTSLSSPTTQSQVKTTLDVALPISMGVTNPRWQLYLMSDVYVGLDQQQDIQVTMASGKA